MLRFNPVDTIPDGSQPTIGVNSTYTLPNAQSPNGPNLFSGTEGNGNQAKPEIYAMGLRNPSRLFIDPETDIPYSAWVGPDAGSPSATQGPSTYESATPARAGRQLRLALLHGQPAGLPRPRRRRLAAHHQRGRLRHRRPGRQPDAGLVRLQQHRQRLDEQHRPDRAAAHDRDRDGRRPRAAAQPLVQPRQPGRHQRLPELPARERRRTTRRTTAPRRPQLCPYLTASGATVFNGPVYRYEEGEDNSARWPEYWDGRWFLQDFGNSSAKHGLLLDPATDQDGGKPVYADSLRNFVNWNNNYMDSKFGPDGALYVQVYDGFFTTGPGAGMYRIAYTGGPDTPNPDPQWTTTGTANQIQFSLGSSGGVSYEWDFGDGSPVSTEPNPTHTYAQAGTYDVTLTVTYADDEELSETVEVTVGADTAEPTTTAQLNGAAPAPTYDEPVEVTLSATDGTAGTGVEWTEYRVDSGAWTRSENTDEDDPFVTTFTVSGEGAHIVEFRSRDVSGNVEDPPGRVDFTIVPEGGGGESCLPQSDEFDGTTLGANWSVLRPAAGNGPQVANGSLGLPILQGDFIANDALASNTLLQDAPAGEWTVTARLDTSAIDANGEQAGLVIWKSENPNTFSKLVAIQANNGNHQFEHIVTQNGGVNPPIPQSITPAPGGQLPDHVLLRARYDGTKVIGEFSPDEGDSWTLIGQEGHAAPITAPLRVGLAAFRGGTGGGTASFDWFRVHGGSEPGGPIDCAGVCDTRSDDFDGALDTERWGFRHPTTPQTGARAPRAENGSLVLPLGLGAIDQAETGPIGFLGQPMPDGDFTVEAKISAPGLEDDDSRTDDPYAQLGLGLLPDRRRLDRRLPHAQRRRGVDQRRHVLRGQERDGRGPDALAARRPGAGIRAPADVLAARHPHG